MGEFNIALLRKSVEWAQNESYRRNRVRTSYTRFMNKGEHTWLQTAWGQLKLTANAVVVGKPKARQYERWVGVDPLSCGSTGCLAGHVCVLSGDHYLIQEDALEHKHGDVIDVCSVLTADGEVKNISTRAQQLLGITDTEAGRLFSGGLKIRGLEAAAREVAHNHGEEL